MASIYADNFDILITTTLDKVRPVLVDQISNENVLTAWLNSKARITVDGGSVIRRPLSFAFNDTVSSYSGYDLIDTTPQEGLGWAEYTWRQHAGSVVISGEEVKKNSGAAQLINLLQAKVDQLKMSVADDFNAMFWASSAGNSGKDFDPLPLLVKSATTVGNVDPSTYTWWASTLDSSVDLTTFDGVNDMGAMLNTIRVNRGRTDIEIGTQAVYQAYEALAVPNLRFESNALADLGFESLTHRGVPITFDPDAPSGTLYFLDSSHLELVQHADSWLTMTEFQRPYNQDAKVALILSMGNLITDSRRSHGYMTSITTS